MSKHNWPNEPEAFTELIAKLLKDRFTSAKIKITGPLEISLDKRLVSLDDLKRSIHGNEREDHAARVLSQFIQALEYTRQLDDVDLSFDLAAPRILPRVTHKSFFNTREAEFYAHQPFINNTVIMYVVDFNAATLPVMTEQLLKWNIDIDALDQIARSNLATSQPTLTFKVVNNDEGAAALLEVGDGYDASRILLEEIHPQLAPELGGNFIVAIPNRDIFIAIAKDAPDFLKRLETHIAADFKRLPYPITRKLFLMTRDGVADWLPAA